MKRIRQRSGASMVEVMVAVGVMVIVFAGLLQVFLYSSVLGEMSGNITTAVSAAQSQLEEIRGHEFDDITTDYGVSGTPGDTFSVGMNGGAGAITITSVETNLLQVQVTVSWTEKNGRAMSTSMTSLLAKRN